MADVQQILNHTNYPNRHPTITFSRGESQSQNKAAYPYNNQNQTKHNLTL